MAKDFLKFGTWNIESLAGKLNDPEFISQTNQFDLTTFVETWLLTDHNHTDVIIPGFYSFSQ